VLILAKLLDAASSLSSEQDRAGQNQPKPRDA